MLHSISDFYHFFLEFHHKYCFPFHCLSYVLINFTFYGSYNHVYLQYDSKRRLKIARHFFVIIFNIVIHCKKKNKKKRKEGYCKNWINQHREEPSSIKMTLLQEKLFMFLEFYVNYEEKPSEEQPGIICSTKQKAYIEARIFETAHKFSWIFPTVYALFLMLKTTLFPTWRRPERSPLTKRPLLRMTLVSPFSVPCNFCRTTSMYF